MTNTKKLSTIALAALLTTGAFSASPSFAGQAMNGCHANSCKGNAKMEKNACNGMKKEANSCQGMEKESNTCRGMKKESNSCKGMKDSNACNGHGGSHHFND